MIGASRVAVAQGSLLRPGQQQRRYPMLPIQVRDGPDHGFWFQWEGGPVSLQGAAARKTAGLVSSRARDAAGAAPSLESCALSPKGSAL